MAKKTLKSLLKEMRKEELSSEKALSQALAAKLNNQTEELEKEYCYLAQKNDYITEWINYVSLLRKNSKKDIVTLILPDINEKILKFAFFNYVVNSDRQLEISEIINLFMSIKYAEVTIKLETQGEEYSLIWETDEKGRLTPINMQIVLSSKISNTELFKLFDQIINKKVFDNLPCFPEEKMIII